MIEIKKGREPRALAVYRQKPDATYQDMHGAPTGRKNEDGSPETVYDVVLNRLMEEQGHLCAYCMRRIPEKKGWPRATIEHIAAQSKSDNQSALDYKNMLAVCSGNRNAGSDDGKTCDARRKNRDLDLNPLKPETLESIEYRHNGIIFSADQEINRQLNDVLNLNCKSLQLADCRKRALQKLINEIQKKYPEGDIKEYCKKQLKKYQEQEQYKVPYVGILIDWLKKHT